MQLLRPDGWGKTELLHATMRHHFNANHHSNHEGGNRDNSKFNTLYIDMAQWSSETDTQIETRMDTQTDALTAYGYVWLSRYLHSWAMVECGVDPAILPTLLDSVEETKSEREELPPIAEFSLSTYLQETVRATKRHTGKPVALFLDNIDHTHTTSMSTPNERGREGTQTHIQNAQSAFLTEACTLHRHVGGIGYILAAGTHLPACPQMQHTLTTHFRDLTLDMVTCTQNIHTCMQTSTILTHSSAVLIMML